MRRVIIVLIISLITVTFATSKEPCYEKTRNKGIALYNAGNYSKAIEYFSFALKCPDTPANNDLQKRINDCNRMIQSLKEAEEKGKAKESGKKKNETPKKTEPKAKETAKQQPQPQSPKQPTSAIVIPMVYVVGGTFTMGCTGEQGSDCDDVWEKPVHQVTLSSYYIGRTEVTQAQWRAVMGNNPSYFQGDNLPVEQVSWNDIVGTSGSTQIINGITYYSNGFIYKLNRKTSNQYRLPTEAEWEYAARGGASGNGYKYSGSNTVDNVAWYSSNSGSSTHPVGTKSPNELGIYDMSGNVWEWCSDWYGAYSSGSQINPRGASTGSDRVIRGGSWGNVARGARVSDRSYYFPVNRNYAIGFRVACSP